MNDQCQFPGCQNDASVAYCDECLAAVGGHQASVVNVISSVVFAACWFVFFAILYFPLVFAKTIRETFSGDDRAQGAVIRDDWRPIVLVLVAIIVVQVVIGLW